MHHVLRRLDAAGVAVERTATREPDLDDVVLTLTGRSHHAEEGRS